MKRPLCCNCGSQEFAAVERFDANRVRPNGISWIVAIILSLFVMRFETIMCLACYARYEWKGTTRGGWVHRREGVR